MNISSRRWLRIKQELPSIVLLSTISIWEGFNNPIYMNLGEPWRTIYGVIRGGFGAILVVYLFSSIDKFAPYIKLEHIKDTFHASAATNKKVSRLALITGAFIGMFFMWYARHFLRISDFYYIFICANFVLIWALLYRAACRVGSTD